MFGASFEELSNTRLVKQVGTDAHSRDGDWAGGCRSDAVDGGVVAEDPGCERCRTLVNLGRIYLYRHQYYDFHSNWLPWFTHGIISIV